MTLIERCLYLMIMRAIRRDYARATEAARRDYARATESAQKPD